MKSSFLILAILLCWASAQSSGKPCRSLRLCIQSSKYGREMKKAACKDPNFSAKYRKRCKASKCPKRCGLIRDPVCDSNGKKYPNRCEFKKAACKDRTIIMASPKKCEGQAPK